MKSRYAILFVLVLFAATLSGCSTENSDAVFGAHPQGWLCDHGVQALADATSCTACHGANYTGSGQVPSCFSCHLGSAPTFSVHPDNWTTVVTDHQGFAFANSWTSCAVADCHGPDLRGGNNALCATGPSCFTAVGCHSTTDNSPPPPHSMPNIAPADHGPDAKNYTGDGQTQFYCRNCHGTPTNNFDGGFVTTTLLGHTVNNGACSACHTAAKAHPTEWQGTNDQDATYLATHRTVDQTTVDTACTLCHKTTAVGTGPMPGAPSCFSASFTNANAITTGCHANGPGVAPHATNGTYRNPDNHGPDAKTNLGLNFCKDCHAQQLPSGNYRFNVQIGQLINGCEDCHIANAAHPPAPTVLPTTDRWTFRGDAAQTRRTHFAAASPLTNCTLCHGANLDGVGGTGPSCNTCHIAAGALNFGLNCSNCHGTPPDGTADLTGSTTAVDHFVGPLMGNVSAIASHDVCSLCHGAKDDGSGKLAQRNANYQLFDRTTAPQGGDHLDGQIEMNGPTASNTGAAYDFSNQGCNLACHLNDADHQLPANSGLTIAYGDYGGGSGVAGCNGCHGYPPDGNADATTAVPVSHLFADNGVKLLANHNECQMCHGTKDDGTGNHSPATNYNPATDHNTTPHEININTTLQYVSNPADGQFGGCNNACHGNDGTHRFPNSSGLTITGADYGSPSCAGCHDTGAGGAPIVKFGDSHAGVTCESCHPGGTRGVLHGDGGDVNVVLIPNNPTVGINYSANGETGIYLGGDSTSGTTEAQICWNCHAITGISEWGQNTNANTGSMTYNYGSLSNPNWTIATWSSAQSSLFAYKGGAIQSTHAANPALTDLNSAPGVDLVSDIRCSNCHDVHDLNRAPGDNVTGEPYLRGTWKGNPYKEDGAPQAGTTFQNLARAGATPRGNPGQFSNHASGLGGYQIDQNNNYPTWNTTTNQPKTGWQPEDFAGLCELCHGNGNGVWSASEIDNLNYYGAPADDWVGINGHANSVIGGTGGSSPNASNIFNLRGGNLGNSKDPAMAFFGANNPGSSSGGYGFRGYSGRAAGWLPRPTTSKPRIYQVNTGGYEWGATINATTIDSRYHHFPCSKCHSPHAARLPRLMIANCLDTKHNTWDDSFQLASGTNAGPNNTGRSISNWTSAQNCHRLGGIASGAGFEPVDPGAVPGTGSGWNNVTPFD